MTRRTPALALVLMTLVAFGATGCVDLGNADDGNDQMHANAPLDSAADETAADEATPTEGTGMHVSTVQVTGTEKAVITTSKGVVTLELYPDSAPNSVASFIELAEQGFYNGIKFHRVVPRFVVQAGDPQTRDLTPDQVREMTARQNQGQYAAGEPMLGTGGPGWTQKAEFNDRKHVAGTLAMARSRDVDSAGSQFYICLEPQPSLDGQYTVFGQVIEGMDVVALIGVGDTIDSVTITR